MLKMKIYQLVAKDGQGRRISRVFDYFIMILILLSVLAIILESIKEVNNQFGSVLRVFNIISVVVFSIEYLIRLYVSDLTHPSTSCIKSACRFVFSAYGLIDLLAILPFYLPMLIRMDLRFIRTLRLTRCLRILKMNRYNDSLDLIWSVIKEKRSELMVTGFISFLLVLFASFVMYYIEGEQQPEQFPNILASFWCAVATLTTVGYGDVYPITGLGKVISGLIAIMGVGIIALPTGLISAGFMNKIEDKKKKDLNTCPHCGKEID